MTKADIEKKYKLKDSLIRIKLLEYIPVLVISHLASLLISSADSIIVSNYVGAEALAAVQILRPVTSFLGVFSAIIANGTSHCLSSGIIKHDFEVLKYKKAAIIKVITFSVIFISIIQIPIIFGLLKTYNLEANLYTMAREYAIGVMISLPFSIISTASVCQLQVTGKMKVLMVLSIIEGVLNLLLDLLFVRDLKLGIAGASFGSAIASVIRSLLTLAYVHFKTDTYKNIDVKARMEDIKEIITTGFPEATTLIVNAFQSYIIVRLLLNAFEGSTGATIKGVCAFCLSVIGVASASVSGSMRPIISIMNGANDKQGAYNAIRIALRNLFISVGVLSIIIQLNPEMFYHLHGIKEIPKYGILSLRLYATCFIFNGFNTIYRLYFVDKGDAKFTARLTLIVNLALPVFAYALYKMIAPPYLWLAYTITASIIFFVNSTKFIKSIMKSKEKTTENENTLYITVTPENVNEATNDLKEYAKTENISPALIDKISTCMEQMVTHAVKSQKTLYLHLQIIISFFDDKAKFVMLDDGKCIHLDSNKETDEILSTNYDNIKKLAKSYDYQYLLNMNYTTLNFEC